MYVLGIDGGGTKTAVSIFNKKDGSLLGVGVGGPSSIDTVSAEVTKKSITEAVEQVLNETNMMHISFASVFAGIGGIASTEDEEKVVKLIQELDFVLPHAFIEAKNDVYNALAGGLATKPGIAIIIGTGSVAFGMDEFGKKWRSGGFHFKEGDAGSAYDLGFQALKAMARAIDGRFKASSFTDDVMNSLNAHDFSTAVKIYDEYFTERTKTAQLAKLVTKHADLGNEYALQIVERATDELALMIQAVDANLNLTNKEVAIIGGLGNAETIYKAKFIEKVKQINPNFNVHRYKVDAVIGAGLMALKNADVPITDDIINKLL